MVKIGKLFILFTCFFCPLLSFSEISGHTYNKVCVIDFSKSEDIESEVLEGIYHNQEGFSYYKEASPEDLRNCFLNGFEEIIIVSHGYNHYSKKEVVSGSFGSSNKPQIPKSRLIYWDPDWSPKEGKFVAIKSKFFEEIAEELNAIYTTGEKPLKSLRLLTCFSHNIVNQYGLRKFAQNMNIALDVAPSIIWSTLDYAWLMESFQLVETDSLKNYSFLIPLNHVILGKYGERTVLGGKYEIKLKGISLGLGEIWIPINIAKEDLDAIPIGETRSILNFDVGEMSLAWIKGKRSTYEANFMQEEVRWHNTYRPAPAVMELGFSLDLISHIEITRLR